MCIFKVLLCNLLLYRSYNYKKILINQKTDILLKSCKPKKIKINNAYFPKKTKPLSFFLILPIIFKLLNMKRILLIFSVLISLNIMAQDNKPETLIVIHTSYGDITAKLYNDTPLHRDNFIKLIKEGWFNNSPFHRVINQFMIQGGQNADGRQDPGYTIPAEILPNHFHKKGALAAARMPDNVNPEKASSGSQFYIVQGRKVPQAYLGQMTFETGHSFTDEQKEVYATIGGTPHLDGGYTVFGEVVMGLEVVDKIAAVETGYRDKPLKPVTMTIEILE